MIDPHMHLWDLSLHEHPWLMGTPHQKNYLLKDYLSESSKYLFEKAVHIQAGIARPDSVLETAWIHNMDFPFAIVGFVDLSQNNCEAVIEQHCEYSRFTGVRQILNSDTPDYLQDSTWVKNLKLLSKYNLSFDMQIHPEQIEQACPVISKTESLFIIDHFCMPKKTGPMYYEYWEKQIKKLAEYDNVCCKLSGFGMSNSKWTVEDIRPFVYSALEIFGIDRCMFASNFPVDKLHHSLDSIYDAFTEITAGLSGSEKGLLFSGNADKIYFSRFRGK